MKVEIEMDDDGNIVIIVYVKDEDIAEAISTAAENCSLDSPDESCKVRVSRTSIKKPQRSISRANHNWEMSAFSIIIFSILMIFCCLKN